MSVTPAPASPIPAAHSAIADISYRNYDGVLRTRAIRWWIIAAATIRANVNRKKYGYWIPVALTLLFYFFQGIIFFVNRGFQQKLQEMGGPVDVQGNPYSLALYNGLNSTHLLVAIAAMTVGAAVIASDNRANALLVYLSKPLTRIDYLVGKWMGVFLLLVALTLTPALLMFLFFAVAYNDEGFLKQNPTLILQLFAASVLPAAIHTSLILGFSAWSKTPRLAGALYAALYFVSGIVATTVGSVLQQKDTDHRTPQRTAIVANCSVDGVSSGVAMNLYHVTPQEALPRMPNGGRRRWRNRSGDQAAITPPDPSLLPDRPKLPIMLLLAGFLLAVPLAAAYAKVQAVEVFRG